VGRAVHSLCDRVSTFLSSMNLLPRVSFNYEIYGPPVGSHCSSQGPIVTCSSYIGPIFPILAGLEEE